MAPYIYTGAWVNWTYGAVTGATLTLSSQHASFLVAFLALFVRLAGQNLWAIFCYCAFQIRSSQQPMDALYHQLQVILRNSTGDTATLWESLKLQWRWRKKTERAFKRIIFLTASALFHLALFSAAGILLSKVSTVNPEVLIKSRACGNWPYPYLVDANSSDLGWEVYALERVSYWDNMQSNALRSSDYTASCYNSTDALSPLNPCQPFGKQKIEWSTNQNVPCPFTKEICINDTVVQFDSGFISSHTHFGINSARDRVEYRRIMTCAPIATDGFVSNWINGTDMAINPDWASIYPGEKFLTYHYGTDIGIFNDTTTYAFSEYTFNYPWSGNDYEPSYSLDCEFSLASNPEYTIAASTFYPISQLNRTDADVLLMFLGRNISYTSVINDPWFLGTQPQSIPLFSIQLTAVYYYPSKPVSIIGCTEQHQPYNTKKLST